MSLRGPPDATSKEMAAAGGAADAGPVDAVPHVVLRVLPDGTLLTRTPRGYAQGFHRWESAEDREPRVAVAADAPLVESFPAYSRLPDDALGHLWVGEFKLPDAQYKGTLWTVFDRGGRVLGFVATPGGLGIFEIAADYILGSTTDEFGVEYVELWSLSRSHS